MSSLDSSISVFKCCGLWRPEICTAGWKCYLYNTYTTYVVSLLFSLTFLEFITLVMSLNSISRVIRMCSMIFSIMIACGKIITFFVHRTRISRLLQMLMSDPLRGRDPDEEDALEKIGCKIRFRTKIFIWMKASTVIAMMGMTLIISVPQKIVWIDIWVPFRFAPNTHYIVLMVYEAVGHITASVVNMAYDTFVPGMMMQICLQLQLLRYRIFIRLRPMNSHSSIIPEHDDHNKEYAQKMMVAGWIQHHLLIYEFAAELNRIFSPMIFLQYGSSAILLCVNIYALVQVPFLSPPFFKTLAYNIMLFSQIFLICLAGTDVIEESTCFARSIYETHWYLMNLKSKKSMSIMMTRSIEPIKFTSAGIVETSLESFLRLVKISYSAYNCLQRFTPEE